MQSCNALTLLYDYHKSWQIYRLPNWITPAFDSGSGGALQMR